MRKRDKRLIDSDDEDYIDYSEDYIDYSEDNDDAIYLPDQVIQPPDQTIQPLNNQLAEYSRESLEKKTKNELTILCKRSGIIFNKKTKAQLVSSLEKYHSPGPETERDYLELKGKLETMKGHKVKQTNQHQYYREIFNAIDLHDRQWYQLTAPYHLNHWRKKLFFSVFQVFLINSYTLFRESIPDNQQPIDIQEYRNNIGPLLVLFDEENVKEFDKLRNI
jgi:hypothetical protein